MLILNNIQLVFFRFAYLTTTKETKPRLDNIQQQNINYDEKNASQSQRPSMALT